MHLIDTHSHLYLPQFDSDFEAVIQRAKQNNIQQILLPNIDEDSVAKILTLQQKNPKMFFAMMGLHPTSVQQNWKKQLDFILTNKNVENIFAIGEIGLDYYWSTDLKAQQIEAFEYQITFAKKHQLPIAVHCRNAFDDILTLLEKHSDKNLKGVLHCFTGNTNQAQRLIDIGFYLGIGGVLTYKNSGLDKTIAPINLKHLILETDAPFLPPTPHRGKRNESSYTLLVAQKLAEIKNISLEKVAQQTTQNAKKLFGLEI